MPTPAVDASVPDADAAALPPDASCPAPLLSCASACIDPRFDPENCGACAAACPLGEVCTQGRCALECAGGATKCGAACVDTVHDPAHCGGCATACDPAQLCINGVCALDCLGGTLRCGSSCVDVRNDPANCGGCGLTCGIRGVCVNGTCAPLSLEAGPPCDAGASYCGGHCVDTSSDTKNCGGCGNVCASDRTCTGGSYVCAGSTTDCNGACVDLATSTANCGACGTSCGDNEVCSARACVCAPGTTSCGGVCTDTSISMADCGGCGKACAPGNVCTNGKCAAPTSAWTMFGYDAAHSGQNTAERGVPPAVTSWSRAIGNGGALHPVTVEGGRAFVSQGGTFGATEPLVAVSVSDGSPLWTYNFGAVESVGHPAAVGGLVYIETNHGTQGSSALWALDEATGTVKWTSPFASQWESFWAPLVAGGTVYMNGGEYGGLYAFRVKDGIQVFSDNSVGQYDSWSPAFFGGAVYTFVAGNIVAHDPTSGAAAWSTSVTWNWSGYSMNTAPVFGPSLGYVVAPPNLVAFDPSTKAVSWTSNRTYSGTPAIAAGVVYAISAGHLIANDATTGAYLWTFVGDGQLTYPPVIANGFVYVSSDKDVYAVDLKAHTSPWNAPVGGWLSLASGRLLVAGSTGVLHGFVLTQ